MSIHSSGAGPVESRKAETFRGSRPFLRLGWGLGASRAGVRGTRPPRPWGSPMRGNAAFARWATRENRPMRSVLYRRNFLKELDFTKPEIEFLLELSGDLKRSKKVGTEERALRGKNIALIFEKASTRTRCAFEVAAHDQGAQVTYLGPEGSQIGHKESMKDTARVLGRMYDGIEYRGFAQSTVETLGEFAGVPVWNGLTDQFHPTQMVCDILTMIEHSDKHLHEIAY